MKQKDDQKVAQIKIGLLSILLLLGTYSGIMGCGGSGSGSSSVSAQSITTSLGDMTVGSVADIPFGSAGSAKITFSNLTGREQFIVSFQAHTTSSGTYSTGITGSESLLGESLQSSLMASRISKIDEEPSSDPMEATETFHEFLRAEEANLPIPSQSLRLSMSGGGGSLRESVSAGDSLSVKVLNSLSSTSSYSTITCQVRVVTSHFIACRDSSSSSLSDSNLSTLMTNFEAQANTEYSTYGSVSDIDGNGKVIVVFSPVLNSLGGSGGIVTGYFFAGDLYPNSYASSNGGEYLFCHVPDGTISTSFYMSNTGPNCMPHELQHAINYNMRVFQNSTSSEPGAHNEGLSHLAEHVFGNNNENPSRVNLYFGTNLASFTGGTSLSQRGGSYLFYRYIYEQANNGRFSGLANGTAFLSSMLNRSQTGLDAVAAATGENINTLLSDFLTTLYLSNTGLSTNSRYNFSGINLRASQDDNRGTVLDGPTVKTASSLPVSGSVLATSSNYTMVTGAQIQSAGNSLSLSASSSSSPYASLIRIGDR